MQVFVDLFHFFFTNDLPNAFVVYLRKLADDEQPLFLRLCAGPNEKVLSLVLKENETGEVNVSIEHTNGK